MNNDERPELDEETIEEVADKSVVIIGKKILKFGLLLGGFAVVGIALAKALAPEDDNIYVIEETGEVVDEPEA